MSFPATRSWDRVRTRLLAAFLVLLVAAIALTAVGWIGMRGTQRALTGLEDQLLPNIARALELAERTTQLAALAPRLADSQSKETLSASSAAVYALLEQIHRRSIDLPPADDVLPLINRLQQEIARSLSKLIKLTQDKQAVQAQFQSKLDAIEHLGKSIHSLGPRARPMHPTVVAIWSSLILGSNNSDAATLGKLEADVEALVIAHNQVYKLAPYDRALAKALLEVGSGPRNLLALRRTLLEHQQQMNYLVVLTRANAEELSGAVNHYVAQLRLDAAQRSERVVRAIRSGETGMLILALVCLAIAAGATRYVRRLVSEIEKITDVMLRLAKGDTSPSMPATLRRDELGALARTFEIFRDNLLAKQKLLSDLKNQRELLEAVHNSMTDGLAVFDHQNRLILWNPQLATLLFKHAAPPQEGQDSHTLLANLPWDSTWVVPGHSDPQPLNTMHDAIFSAFDHIELRLPGGQVFDLRTRSMPGGGTVTLTTDLTSRRTIELQLQNAQKLEVLGQLTGGVAHDFNNYLGTILGNLSLLETQIHPTERAQAQLQRVQRAATSAAMLTRRLLAFARRQPLEAEHVGIDEMIEEMRDLIEYSAGAHVSVHFSLAAALCHVYVDRGQLENALLNLVLNSAAAMPTGGHLSVQTRHFIPYANAPRSEQTGQIEVTDTGTGIPQHLLNKVFEPFFTTKAAGEGSGLGLSIVYGFVKQSGGNITISSTPKRGTTVLMTFPLSAPAEVAPILPLSARTLPAKLEGQRILVVDNDETFRNTVMDLLAIAKLQPQAAASAEEALAILEQGPKTHIVLSDICLGSGMDGLTLAQNVRMQHPGVQIGLMSGLSPELYGDRESRIRAFPFLQKPFGLNTLIDWLTTVFAPSLPDQ